MVRRSEILTNAELTWINELEGTSEQTEVDPVENTQPQPPIQLIANLVVRRADGQVLFVRYDPDDERWGLPGEDLHPYEHPDEAAQRILAEFSGLTIRTMGMHEIESFRGRRGWHVVFHFRVDADGDVQSRFPTAWFALSNLPRTPHGRWEKDIARRLAGSSS
jgi:ADP-ribose pyrophosphatase YjhB (NUDIX family)